MFHAIDLKETMFFVIVLHIRKVIRAKIPAVVRMPEVVSRISGRLSAVILLSAVPLCRRTVVQTAGRAGTTTGTRAPRIPPNLLKRPGITAAGRWTTRSPCNACVTLVKCVCCVSGHRLQCAQSLSGSSPAFPLEFINMFLMETRSFINTVHSIPAVVHKHEVLSCFYF